MVNLLILSDIHGSIAPLLALDAALSSADLILVAGDLTEFGGREEAAEIIGILRESGVPVMAITGNCDRVGARDLLEAEGVSLEGRCREHGGLLVAGAGGGIRRTGVTPFERPDEELAAALLGGLGQADELAGGTSSPLAILTHTPPWGGATDLRHGSHVGSPAFGAILAERRPLLWISGHIHEAQAVARHGPSLLVNPGPLHDGYFATASLDVAARTVSAELRTID